MSCCSLEGTNRFFSRSAAFYEKKFKLSGPDHVQRLILEGLRAAGTSDKTILDVGCGIGTLHLTLLQEGSRSAIGVEISEGMIEHARTLSRDLHVSEKTTYVRGDFVDVAESVPASELVLLDKVVCCYPDPERLIAASTAKCTFLYAVSYPRDSFLGRAAMTIPAFFTRLFRWAFHPYYHSPAFLQTAITRRGFVEVFSATTLIWQVRIYRADSRTSLRS